MVRSRTMSQTRDFSRLFSTNEMEICDLDEGSPVAIRPVSLSHQGVGDDTIRLLSGRPGALRSERLTMQNCRGGYLNF